MLVWHSEALNVITFTSGAIQRLEHFEKSVNDSLLTVSGN